jgi:hypothetical protein
MSERFFRFVGKVAHLLVINLNIRYYLISLPKV